ncbi:hypothetical protein AB0J83_02010 [Actinoplanes sp. NPDC049596]|uniref:hypothetical protein n=1 Tax=unclassified Actinoplanes TaxID=2626549 RepID=UPI0034239366
MHRSLGGWPSILDEADRRHHLLRAVALARESADAGALVYALEALAIEDINTDAAAEAAVVADEGFALARSAGMDSAAVILACRRAEAALNLGDSATAIRMADWALANAAAGNLLTQFIAGYVLALAHARTGDVRQARAAADLFREITRRHHDAYIGLYGPEALAEELKAVDDALAAMGTASALQ